MFAPESCVTDSYRNRLYCSAGARRRVENSGLCANDDIAAVWTLMSCSMLFSDAKPDSTSGERMSSVSPRSAR